MREWKPGIKPPQYICPQEFCFHWRAEGDFFASGLHENLEEALKEMKPIEKSQCGCSFGKCIRDKNYAGDRDWYEPCEPALDERGLPWFYFICNTEGLNPEDRKAYQEYFNELTNSQDVRKVCYHIASADYGDVDYLRYFTGNGTEYYLVCEECSNNKETLLDNLREISKTDFIKHDEVLFSPLEFKGYPQIKTRKTDLKFEHINVKLKREIGEKILDYQPHNSNPNCIVIVLTETLRLLKIDLTRGDYEELCRVSEDTPIDLNDNVSIELSKHGDLCTVVNTYGQFGVVIDISSGKILMRLNRGNYHNDVSVFPIAFIEWKGRNLIVHGTDWNRLDISDLFTGDLITKRGPTEYTQSTDDNGIVRPDRYLDYFHSSITVSENCEWIVDNGWIWHPVGQVVKWSINKWLEDNVWESEDGLSKKELCSRIYFWEGEICWIDEDTVAVFGFGNDTECILPAVRVFNVASGEELYWFAGPDNWLFFDIYLFSASPEDGTKVWDVNSGELLHTDESFCPGMYHKGSKTFISVVSANEYRLSRLIE